MNDDDQEIFIRKRLQSRFAPLKDAELKVDLWPRMPRRFEQPPVTFGWFESIMVGLVALTFAIFPKLLPAMLYHL